MLAIRVHDINCIHTICTYTPSTTKGTLTPLLVLPVVGSSDPFWPFCKGSEFLKARASCTEPGHPM